MKKIVGIIAAAALATSAFAEINIGSWNRAVFVPMAYDGENVNALENTSWGGSNAASYGVRVGLGFSASTDNAGFVLDAHVNPGDSGETLGLGDNGYAWVKPVDMLQLKFGKMDNNWGRQDVCFGMWDRYRFGGRLCLGEGVGMWREHAGTGFEATLRPVDGLVIDYQGGFNGSKNDFIASAADITAVENLWLSFATTIPTLISVNKADAAYIPFGVGAAYNMDALTIHGLARFALHGTPNDDLDGLEFGKLNSLYVGVGADYAINDQFTLVADVRLHTYLGDKDYVDAAQDAAAFGVYAGVSEKLSNATFDLGVMIAKSGAEGSTVGASDNGENKTTFAIPLTMTVSF